MDSYCPKSDRQDSRMTYINKSKDERNLRNPLISQTMNLISSMFDSDGVGFRSRVVRRLMMLSVCLAALSGSAVLSRAATNTATSDVDSHVLSLLGASNTNRLAAPTTIGTPAHGAPPTNQPMAAPKSNPIETNTPTVPSSAEIVNLLDDHHKLAIGDRISFRIIEDEEEPKPLVVTDSGEIEFPFIGRQAAEGKTCRQLAALAKTALEKDYYIEATVIIAIDLMAKTRGRVYLVGALRAPGPQEIPSDETLTLSKAILRSGGFTDVADRKNVKITRKTGTADSDKQTFVVNVGKIYDSGMVENDVPLQPGDLILVPDRKIRF